MSTRDNEMYGPGVIEAYNPKPNIDIAAEMHKIFFDRRCKYKNGDLLFYKPSWQLTNKPNNTPPVGVYDNGIVRGAGYGSSQAMRNLPITVTRLSLDSVVNVLKERDKE